MRIDVRNIFLKAVEVRKETEVAGRMRDRSNDERERRRQRTSEEI